MQRNIVADGPGIEIERFRMEFRALDGSGRHYMQSYDATPLFLRTAHEPWHQLFAQMERSAQRYAGMPLRPLSVEHYNPGFRLWWRIATLRDDGHWMPEIRAYERFPTIARLRSTLPLTPPTMPFNTFRPTDPDDLISEQEQEAERAKLKAEAEAARQKIVDMIATFDGVALRDAMELVKLCDDYATAKTAEAMRPLMSGLMNGLSKALKRKEGGAPTDPGV